MSGFRMRIKCPLVIQSATVARHTAVLYKHKTIPGLEFGAIPARASQWGQIQGPQGKRRGHRNGI